MISIVDICKVCEGSSDLLRKGEQYFRNGLMCVGIKERHDTLLTCIGFAAQKPGVLTNPYQVECEVELDNQEGDMVLHLNCTCTTASSSQCEHCIALLMYLNKVEAQDLDNLTCADLEQRWEVIKGSHYQQAKSVAELCQLDSQNQPLLVTKEMRDKWRKILIRASK